MEATISACDGRKVTHGGQARTRHLNDAERSLDLVSQRLDDGGAELFRLPCRFSVGLFLRRSPPSSVIAQSEAMAWALSLRIEVPRNARPPTGRSPARKAQYQVCVPVQKYPRF